MTHLHFLSAGIAYCSGILLATFSPLSWADTGVDSQLRDKSVHYGEQGLDLSIGLAAYAGQGSLYRGYEDKYSGITLLGGISYRYQRFFAAYDDDIGTKIGVTLFKNEDWALDAVYGPEFGIHFDGNDELAHLNNRDTDGLLSLQFSHYHRNSRFFASIGHDVIDAHDGMVVSSEYAREWQLKNWVLTGYVGAAWIDQKMANHIAGISSEEATSALPAYQADSGEVGWLALRAEYPLRENWVLRASASSMHIGDTFRQSPLNEDSHNESISVGIKYAF